MALCEDQAWSSGAWRDAGRSVRADSTLSPSMNQEHRVWLAAILSSVVLVASSQLFGRATPPKEPTQPQTVQAITPDVPRETKSQLITNEEVIELQSKQLLLAVGKESASVRAVTLKDYTNIHEKDPLKFGNTVPILVVSIGDRHNSWTSNELTPTTVSWFSDPAPGISSQMVVEIESDRPVYTVSVVLKNASEQPQRIPVKLTASWKRGDEIAGNYNMLEAVLLTEKTTPWQRTHLTYRAGTTQPRDVPRGTSLITLSERFFCQSIKFGDDRPVSATLVPAMKGEIAVMAESVVDVAPNGSARYGATVYTGPRDFFRLRDAGFEQAFATGLLTKIGLFLMFLLKLIASAVRNYGTAIIILAAGITAALSPFTMISFRSMKKMQELQPKMDQLKAKYANDPQRVNKETLQLFREHKVSPLSGCLPMFLQMPIFFALWSAISHVIELRGAPFLWIKDLSLPDRLAKLPMGLDLNVLPLLMAGAMYIQTKLSQPKTQTSASSMFAGPLMPVLFGVMFYQVPSGLVLYWLTNSVTSILWYRLAKI